jgi:hypothetical protein
VTLRREHHHLHVAQVKPGMLHIDEDAIVPGLADQFDDLRLPEASPMRRHRHPPLTQDTLDPIL